MVPNGCFYLTFVEHPDDDEAILVAGGEFLVRLVPAHHLNLPVVPLQRLVHRQVRGRRQTLHLPILPRFELPVDNKNEIFIFLAFDSFLIYLQHFEQTIVPTASDVTLVLVPSDAF